MRYNSGQKAQQALEELVKGGSREERLKAAWAHLTLAGGRDYAEDCQEIIEAFQSGDAALKNGGIDDLAVALREMIELVLMEEGANKTLNELMD